MSIFDRKFPICLRTGCRILSLFRELRRKTSFRNLISVPTVWRPEATAARRQATSARHRHDIRRHFGDTKRHLREFDLRHIASDFLTLRFRVGARQTQNIRENFPRIGLTAVEASGYPDERSTHSRVNRCSIAFASRSANRSRIGSTSRRSRCAMCPQRAR